MKNIEVTFYATKLLRAEHRTVIAMPDDFTQSDIDRVVDSVYDDLPKEEFKPCPSKEDWERETVLIGKESIEEDAEWVSTQSVKVRGTLTATQIETKRVKR